MIHNSNQWSNCDKTDDVIYEQFIYFLKENNYKNKNK